MLHSMCVSYLNLITPMSLGLPVLQAGLIIAGLIVALVLTGPGERLGIMRT